MFGVIRGIYRGASREPLTSKRGHNFYKGKGTGAMGWHTRRGGYRIDWSKVRNFVVPDMTNCKLAPYVSRETQKLKHTISPQDFLNKPSA
ncbi:mitochondrial 54S ribosomal protein mL41 [Calcarisporiella thermophila]|uniref:mitochondrial 54S ribosomal protein mL41 n=1 Tax=Calcarisporiella thermophila TaxID=911321 RepID=UPI00374215A1